jgi:hypothetical protein
MNLPKGWPGGQQQPDPQVTQQPASPPYAAAPQTQGEGDIFDKVANAEDRDRRITLYPIPGAYPVLLVDVVKIITSRQNETFFVAELEILQSMVQDRPPGTRMTWMVNMKHDSSPRNVKEFICALMAVDSEAVTPEAVKYACGPDNPCHGRLVRLEAAYTKLKRAQALTMEEAIKTQAVFTVCDWYTLGDEVQAKVVELRKAAGFDVDIPF